MAEKKVTTSVKKTAKKAIKSVGKKASKSKGTKVAAEPKEEEPKVIPIAEGKKDEAEKVPTAPKAEKEVERKTPLNPLSGSVVIDMGTLKKRLDLISKVILGTPPVPILECYHISGENGVLKITGSDIESYVTGKMAYKGEDFKLCFNAKNLNKIVKACKGSLEILGSDKGTLKLKSGKNSFVMPFEDAEDFPMYALPKKSEVSFDIGTTFIENFKHASLCASTDETRPEMAGVLIEATPGTLNLVATDAHVLYQQEFPTTTTGEFKGIISKQLQKLLVSGTASAYKNQFSIKSKEFDVVVKMIGGIYPDYKAIIPNEDNCSITVNKASFVEATKKLLIATNKQMPQASFEVEDGDIKMASKDYDYGIEAATSLDCSHEGECYFFSMNIELAGKILGTMTSESVTFVLKSSNAPIRIEGDNESRIIMPTMAIED